MSLIGYAQSNARVSTLMRNIESSQWLEEPKLNEIKAATVNNKRVSEFNLDLGLKRATVDTAKDAGKAAAKAPAGAPAAAPAPDAAAKKG